MPSVLFWTAARLIHKPSETHPGQHKGKPNIMKKNLQTFEQEFMDLCEKREWEIAGFYLNDLYKKGHEDLADRLREKYLELFEEANDYTFEPYQHPTPPVLEACWFEGTPKEYAKADADRSESLDQTYRELTQIV